MKSWIRLFIPPLALLLVNCSAQLNGPKLPSVGDDFLNMTITSSGVGLADDSTPFTFTVNLINGDNTPVVGFTPQFTILLGNLTTNLGCTASNASGASYCNIRSGIAELKRIQLSNTPLALTHDMTFIAVATLSRASAITSSQQNIAGAGGYTGEISSGSVLTSISTVLGGGEEVFLSRQGELSSE